jgi:glycine/D-amino acid oxidase-like deaminating enzyme
MNQEGELHADVTVVAAGSGAVQLAASVDVEISLRTPPGLLVHSKPAGEILNGLIIAPELHMRQTAEGRLVAGSDFGGADPGENPDETARALFEKVQATIKGGERIEFDFHTVGYRPTPEDGLPLVGRPDGVDGLYIAVMHSGITNAAATGLLASREIMTGDRDELLEPFNLQRLLSRAPAT